MFFNNKEGVIYFNSPQQRYKEQSGTKDDLTLPFLKRPGGAMLERQRLSLGKMGQIERYKRGEERERENG